MVESGRASWRDVDIIAVVTRGDFFFVVWGILYLDMGNIDFGGYVGGGMYGIVERGG